MAGSHHDVAEVPQPDSCTAANLREYSITSSASASRFHRHFDFPKPRPGWMFLPSNRLAIERGQQFRVVSVDIATEVHNTAIDPSGQIGNVHGQRLLQVHDGGLGRGNHLVDPIFVPSRNATCAKNLIGKLERPGKPDTSVAESPLVAAEQAARGTVVKIDVVRVWKHELDAAQRVVGARPLPKLKREISTSVARPVE